MVRVYIKTSGCSNNFSEGEVMKGLLKKAEFEIVDSRQNADIIVLNICTVKGQSITLKSIRKTKEQFPHKKLIVAGCIPAEMINDIRNVCPDASFLSTHNICSVVEVAEETANGNSVEMLACSDDEKINLPKLRKNPLIGIVPVASGCASSCSYCSVKLIKGQLSSYPAEKIIKEISQCLSDGCREIWITSQDTACYGRDIGTSLAALLKKALCIKGDFMVRLGMANPCFVLQNLDVLVDVFRDEKMYKFLHIPVQSGNNEILAAMNRHYTVEGFKKIVRAFREAFPTITISTDIICGFPGETKEQFQDSVRLVRELKPDILNISRFAARPGTAAAKLQHQIDGNELKERSRCLTSVFEWLSFENNSKWKGWEGSVLISEAGKGNSNVGRNYAYRPVIVKGNAKLGDKVNVRITSVTEHDLRGVIV